MMFPRAVRSRLFLLSVLAAPGALAAACDDRPVAPLDAGDSGGGAEAGAQEDASIEDGAALDADAGSDARSDAASCTFMAPDAAALPVTTCTAKFGNGADRVVASAVAVDPGGNIIITGSIFGSTDFGGGALTSAGGLDIFIVKLDPSCRHIWSRRFGSVGDQGGQSLATNGDGEIFLTSFFVGTVDFGTGPLTAVEPDTVLTKLDPCGNVLWARGFGTSGSNVRRDIVGLALDSQSNVIVGGGYYGSVNFGAGVQNGTPDLANGSGTDICLAKLDRDGKHVWSKTLTRLGDAGGTGAAYSAAFAPDGTIYVSGTSGPQPSHTIDFGVGPVTFDNHNAAWITRFTAAGVALSTSKFEHVATSLATTRSGKLIGVGTIRDVTDLGTGPLIVNGPNGPTSPEDYIAEFTTDGSSASWVRAFGTKNPPRSLQNLRLAVSDAVIGITGRCDDGIDLGSGIPCSSNFAFFARYGIGGSFLSYAQHPTGAIAVTPTNQFVVAGFEGDTPGAPDKVTVTKFAP